jgi:transcriptional regulator with XRE-family HTH domain
MAVRPRNSEADKVPEPDIGARLREERTRRGLSLRKLASILGLSPSALSQIETGRSRPSVSTLYAIVNQLEISFDDLFGTAQDWDRSTSDEDDDADSIVVRTMRHDPADFVVREDARQVIDLESGVVWARLNPEGDPDVEFLEVTYDVGGSSSVGDTYVRHAGREYGLVLSGRLRVTVGFDTFELEPGDSICFDSRVPHQLATIGDQAVKAVWVVIGRSGSDSRAGWNER